MTGVERHARLLLRCYPRVWRERYGEELTELLLEDLADRPRSFSRDADVMRAGARARLAACGVVPGPVRDASTVRRTAAGACAIFVAATLSIWTQLADGWLTARPDSALVGTSLLTLSVGLGAFLVAATVAGVRLAAAIVRTVRAGRTAEVGRPLGVFVVSAAVLAGGVRVMAPRWPGAALPPGHGILAVAARTGWAVSDPISTFWLHPHRLLALPAVELAWMVVCPAAVGALVCAVVRLGRVCRLREPMAARVRSVGRAVVLLSLLTAAAWVVCSQHAVQATYRAGTLDLVLIAAMLAAVLVARNAAPSSQGAAAG